MGYQVAFQKEVSAFCPRVGLSVQGHAYKTWLTEHLWSRGLLQGACI